MYSSAEMVREVLQGYVDPSPSDPDITAANLSDAQIEREIANVDSEINMVLARRGYVVPVVGVLDATDPARAAIRNLSIDLASALSDMVFRGGAKSYGGDGTNAIRLRYDRAKELLDYIGQGAFVLLGLPTVDDPTGNDPNAGQAVFNAYRPNLEGDVYPRGFDLVRNGAEYAEDETLIIRQPRYRRY